MPDHAERFRVEGTRLQVTERFDPRFQPRSGAELLRILSDIMRDNPSDETILDLHECAALPSMMLGCITEARHIVDRTGGRLRLRLRADHYEKLGPFGVWKLFETGETSEADGVACQELLARPKPPAPPEGETPPAE